MKVQITEHSVKLVPESSFEEEALAKLRKKGVDKVQFEDDWDAKGYLELVYPTHSWDR